MFYRTLSARLPLMAAFAAFAAACSNDGTLGPGDVSQLRFSEPITIGELNDQLVTAPARVEIKLFDEGLVAREVEIESNDEMFDDEKLEFSITSIDDAGGTIVVDFADLVIAFNGSTRFKGFDEGNMTRADFVAHVERELADGRRVGVEAKRAAPAEPQAPDDPTFVAMELELEHVDDRKIKMAIDSDNLTVNDPDAVIQVLGRQVEVRLGDGTTKLEREDQELDDEIKFRGLVQSTGADFFTLENGQVIRVVEGVTQIDQGDGGKRLGSLAEVQAAIDAMMSVRAKGEAIVDPDDANALVAVEVRFKVKREDQRITLQALAELLGNAPARAEIQLRDGGLVVRELEIESENDDEQHEEDIEAAVTAIDGAGSVTVNIEGLVVSFDDNTRFKNRDGDEVSREQFVTLVEAELAANRMPHIKAKRPSAMTPQAPDDGTFLASRIELEDDDRIERKMEIVIDAANLTVNESRPDGGPDATLQVLGITLELRTTEGLTELEIEG